MPLPAAVTMATLPAGALPFGSTLLSLQRPLLSQGGMLAQARCVINRGERVPPDEPARVFTQPRRRGFLRSSQQGSEDGNMIVVRRVRTRLGSGSGGEDLVSLIRRYPLITFFVLAYTLSWWPWILYALDLLPQPIVGFGPFLAAIVVLAITRGKTGVVGLLRRMVRWRVGLRWYAVALLLPVAISLAAAVFNVLLGAQAPSSVELSGWVGLFSTFFLLLLVPGIGGAWEEPGWRGYALPRLQVGRSALFASLILWIGIVVWHLPLMLVGEIHWSDVVFILGFVIVFNWVFNNANGSVLILMLMHAMNNTISGSFFGPMFSGVDSVRQAWLYAALWCAVAIVVVVVYGPQHLSRKHRKQEEPEQPEVSTASPRVV
jgi:uncharacterized protein